MTSNEKINYVIDVLLRILSNYEKDMNNINSRLKKIEELLENK